MDGLCKEYIKSIKAFFPVMGKKEKEYLKNLELNIKDFCCENSVTSMEALYKDFGMPSEVANSYFSNVQMDYLLKKINISQKVKMALISFMILMVMGMSIFSGCLFAAYNQMQNQLIFFEETTIK